MSVLELAKESKNLRGSRRGKMYKKRKRDWGEKENPLKTMQIRFHLEGQNIIKMQQKVRPPFIYLCCHLQWQLSVFTPSPASPPPSALIPGVEKMGGLGGSGALGKEGELRGNICQRRSVALSPG